MQQLGIKLTDERATALKRVEQKQDAFDSLSAHVEQIDHEQGELSTLMTQTQGKLNGKERTIEELNKAIDKALQEAEANVPAVRTSLDEERSKVVAFESQLSDKQALIERLESDKQSLQAETGRVEDLVRQLEESKASIERLEREKTESADAIQQRQIEEIAQLNEQLESKKALIYRLVQEKDDTGKHVESLHADLNSERSSVHSLTEHLAEKQRLVDELQSRALQLDELLEAEKSSLVASKKNSPRRRRASNVWRRRRSNRPMPRSSVRSRRSRANRRSLNALFARRTTPSDTSRPSTLISPPSRRPFSAWSARGANRSNAWNKSSSRSRRQSMKRGLKPRRASNVWRRRSARASKPTSNISRRKSPDYEARTSRACLSSQALSTRRRPNRSRTSPSPNVRCSPRLESSLHRLSSASTRALVPSVRWMRRKRASNVWRRRRSNRPMPRSSVRSRRSRSTTSSSRASRR